MTAAHIDKNRNDDPLRMREMLTKATDLAEGHSIVSVMVGMTATTGDLLFPEFVAFVESALRVDDAIFRMTRERAVLFLADVKLAQAEEIVERNLTGFRNHFPTAAEPTVSLRYFSVTPDLRNTTLKDVLPALFIRSVSH